MSSSQNGPTQPGHPEGIVPGGASSDGEAFRRQAALKAILPGMDKRQVIGHPEAEESAYPCKVTIDYNGHSSTSDPRS